MGRRGRAVPLDAGALAAAPAALRVPSSVNGAPRGRMQPICARDVGHRNMETAYPGFAGSSLQVSLNRCPGAVRAACMSAQAHPPGATTGLG